MLVLYQRGSVQSYAFILKGHVPPSQDAVFFPLENLSPRDSSALASPLLGLQMCGFWGLRSSHLHGGHTTNQAITQHSWSVFLSTGSHYFLKMPWNSQCSPGWP